MFTTNPTSPALSLNTELCCERPTTKSLRNNRVWDLCLLHYSLLKLVTKWRTISSMEQYLVRSPDKGERKHVTSSLYPEKRRDACPKSQTCDIHLTKISIHAADSFQGWVDAVCHSLIWKFVVNTSTPDYSRTISSRDGSLQAKYHSHNLWALTKLHKYYSKKLLFLLPAKAPSHCCVTKLGAHDDLLASLKLWLELKQGAWSRQG